MGWMDNVLSPVKRFADSVAEPASPMATAYFTAPTPTGSTALTGTPTGTTPMSELAALGDKTITGAGNVFNSQIDGTAYDKFAAYKTNMADRAEQGQRATSALGIARAGFGGTPMGAYAGNATESTILQNRFDNALALEAARQNSQLEGAKLAVGYANSVADYNANKVTDANDYTSAIFDGDEDLRQRVSTATTAEDITRIGQDIAVKYPNIVEYFRTLYGRDPTAEDLGNLALNHYKGTSEAYQKARTLAETGGYTIEEAQGVIKDIDDGLYDLGRDEDGNVKVNINKVPATTQSILSGEIKADTYVFKDGESDPVYKMLSSKLTDGKGSAEEVVGKREGTMVQLLGMGRADNPGQTQNPVLEAAYSSASKLVNYGGKLYVVTNISRTDFQRGPDEKFLTGTSTYTLQDVLTGEPITVRTSTQWVTF